MRWLGWLWALSVAMFPGETAFAGGSGLNVIVVVNQNSPNSLTLANDYCELRGVPPQNALRLTNWTGSAITWSRADFESRLLNPLLAFIHSRALTNQAEFVLLSMDIPYRVVDGASQNSTSSALFYGFKTNSTPPTGLPATCSLPDASSNSYAFSELPFRDARPNTAPTNSFLVMLLTDTTLAGAEAILNRGVASDSTFPTQTVILAKTSDSARNVRFQEFDNAILDGRVRGDSSLLRIDTGSASFTNLLGLLTGLATFSLPDNAFVPGAIGDSLTSYGGNILESSGQTTLLAFLNAGAAGSYGTVVEPCNYLAKFPDPMDYVYQNRGFSLAEAYYQSVLNPYQGLMVGEPLAAPFARHGAADWTTLTNGTVLSGQAALSLAFSAAAMNLPLSQADLFLDGNFLQTLTNLPPTEGNELSVIVNGLTVGYSVPAGATLPDVAKGLAAAMNAQTNSTKVQADSTGDRIILRTLDAAQAGSAVSLTASAAVGSAAQLTTQVTAAQPAFVDSAAVGDLTLLASRAPMAGDWLRVDFIKTNGTLVTVSVTNSASNTNITSLVQSLMSRINSTPALQSSDGVSASDYDAYSGNAGALFTLYARSGGWRAAQIQVTLTASPNLRTSPSGTNRLEDNLSDLQARNHLYLSSGVISLPVNFVLDTTPLPDGFHELTAVAYEGTSVRTQTRVSRSVRVQNTALTATLTPTPAQTNVMIDTLLQFAVAANTTNIARVELFSTGGSLGVVSNQPATLFPVTGPSLGVGLHPFYVVVTDASGNAYRTETAWIRLIPLIQLSITGPPLMLTWPAAVGQRYEVLGTTDLAAEFLPLASVVATNVVAQWPLPAAGPAAFYRVQWLGN